MNSRNNSYRGFGFYLVLILIVVGVWYFLDGNTTTNSYTRAAFEKDIQSGDVTAIDIVQNREIPTGSVNLTFLDSTQKVLIVSDVNEIVSYLQDQDITYYTMENVPAESWIMTLLPYLIIFGAMFIFFMIMTNQAAANAGGGSSKMMNFGKSRAKLMQPDAKKVTFANVAGLKEEKEELEEIVDFLRAPQKYTALGARIPKGVLLVGPPGTGKTTTLVEAVYETLHRENQVMVSAQSNTAVDWIAEKLVDRGIPVLRIGNPTRVNDKMLAFTYERRFEAHSDYPELWQIRKTIREMTGRLRKSGREDRERLHNQLTKLRVRATGLEIRIDTELFTEARVIACTLVGAASRVLERKRFSSLFIDEAAQAIEAACWIAISRADRVILAGDHCQLPPTIKCIEAARGGLGRTLLEKVVLHKPETMSLLKIQYRMHEDIMRFPSRWFYHDELEAAPEVKYRGILDFDTPVSWIDTSELDLQEKAVAEGTGRLNTGEAELLVRELKNYMERIGIRRILEEHIDFGVISPYRAQVHYLRHLLKKEPFFRPCRRLITVHTVDGFQGQERDVIMISLVRANEKGQIGFLRDLRRMNVAITRARMKLLILGEAVTLTRHPFYRELYEYIGELR